MFFLLLLLLLLFGWEEEAKFSKYTLTTNDGGNERASVFKDELWEEMEKEREQTKQNRMRRERERRKRMRSSRTIFQWAARTIRLNADHAGRRLGGPGYVSYL